MEPNHHHHAVGPMAARSLRRCRVVVENKALRIGLSVASGGRQQFGDYSDPALQACASGEMSGTLVRKASSKGRASLKPLSLKHTNGDELHNRSWLPPVYSQRNGGSDIEGALQRITWWVRSLHYEPRTDLPWPVDGLGKPPWTRQWYDYSTVVVTWHGMVLSLESVSAVLAMNGSPHRRRR